MTSLTSYQALWYQALQTEIGLIIATPDRDKTKQMLYRARKEANDPMLDLLTIATSPTDPTHLWIMRKTT